MAATRPVVLLATRGGGRRLTCLAGGRGRGVAGLGTIYGGNPHGGDGDGGMHTMRARGLSELGGRIAALSPSSSLSLSPVASASNLGSARPRANTNASSLARVRPPRLIAPAGRTAGYAPKVVTRGGAGALTNTRSPLWKVAGSAGRLSARPPQGDPEWESEEHRGSLVKM